MVRATRKASPSNKQTKDSRPVLQYSSADRKSVDDYNKPFFTTHVIDYLEKAATYLKNVVDSEFPKDTLTFSLISLSLQKFLLQLENARTASPGELITSDSPILILINNIYDKRKDVAAVIERVFVSGVPHLIKFPDPIRDPAVLMHASDTTDVWKLLFLSHITWQIDTRMALTYVTHYVVAELEKETPLRSQDGNHLQDFLLYIAKCEGFNGPSPKALSILLNFGNVERPGNVFPHYICGPEYSSVESLRVYAIAHGISTLRDKLLTQKPAVSKQVEKGDDVSDEIESFELIYGQYVNLQTLLSGYLQMIAAGRATPSSIGMSSTPISYIVDFAIATCFTDAKLRPHDCALPLGTVSAWASSNERNRAMTNLSSQLGFQYVPIAENVEPPHNFSVFGGDPVITGIPRDANSEFARSIAASAVNAHGFTPGAPPLNRVTLKPNRSIRHLGEDVNTVVADRKDLQQTREHLNTRCSFTVNIDK